MQNLFNAAALNGGYYNTAALDGGMYNTAALEGGSELYDEAAVVGGFALAELANAETAPGDEALEEFGRKTLLTLPPTVRDTIAKMFNPRTDEAKKQIYYGMALLYVLDSLKAISIAPEMDIPARNLARQRWIIMQKKLQSSSTDQKHAYTRLLRYIHIPHHSPRACKCMRDRWLRSVNNRNLKWGRSRAFHALPHGLSTVKYGKDDLSWTDFSSDIPSVRKRRGKKRSAKTSETPPSKKRKSGRYDEVWGIPTDAVDSEPSSKRSPV